MSLISFVGMYLLSGIVVFYAMVRYEVKRSDKIDKDNGNCETGERIESLGEDSLRIIGIKTLLIAFIAIVAMWPVAVPTAMVAFERNVFGK